MTQQTKKKIIDVLIKGGVLSAILVTTVTVMAYGISDHTKLNTHLEVCDKETEKIYTLINNKQKELLEEIRETRRTLTERIDKILITKTITEKRIQNGDRNNKEELEDYNVGDSSIDRSDLRGDSGGS